MEIDESKFSTENITVATQEEAITEYLAALKGKVANVFLSKWPIVPVQH